MPFLLLLKNRWPALLGWMLVTALVFLRPVGEYPEGGWDPGVYTARAAALAQGDGFFPPDRSAAELGPTSSSAYPTARFGSVKYDGWVATGDGRLEGQFLPAYPTWLAVGWFFAGPLGLAFMHQALVLLTVIGLVYAGRSLGGPVAGITAGIGYVILPVPWWFASFITAEQMLLASFCGGLALLLHAAQTDKTRVAGIAGSLFGFGCWVSLTGWLIALAALFVPLFIGWQRCCTKHYLAWLLVFSLAGVTLAAALSPAYLASLSHLGVLFRAYAWPLAGGLIFGALALFFLSRQAFSENPRPAVLPVGLAVIALGLAALVFFTASTEPGTHLALRKLGSRSLLLLSVLGVATAWLRRPRRSSDFIPLFFALTIGGFFLWMPLMSQLYPWGFKRILPTVLPALLLYLGTLAASANRCPRLRWGLWVVLLLLLARPLFLHHDRVAPHHQKGRHQAFTLLAKDLRHHADLVVASPDLAMPLELIHQLPVFPINDPAAPLPSALQSYPGRIVYVSLAGQKPPVSTTTGDVIRPSYALPETGTRLPQSRIPFARAHQPAPLLFRLQRISFSSPTPLTESPPDQ